MSDIVVCSNKNCCKEYAVENKRTDDGYCSQECWEEAHCGDPRISEDVFDVTTESLLTA